MKFGAVSYLLSCTVHAHYNPFLIWNCFYLSKNCGFRVSEKFLVIQTALQYKPQLIWFTYIDLKCAPYFPPFFHFSIERYGTEAKFSNYFTFYWKRCLVHLLSLLTYEHLGWYVALEIKKTYKSISCIVSHDPREKNTRDNQEDKQSSR